MPPDDSRPRPVGRARPESRYDGPDDHEATTPGLTDVCTHAAPPEPGALCALCGRRTPAEPHALEYVAVACGRAWRFDPAAGRWIEAEVAA